MKKTIKLLLVLICVISLNNNVFAKDKTTYINLDKMTYKDNSNIKEYDNIEDFLKDYNSNKLPNVYITNFLFDGVSEVITPDLDDFIDNNSNDTKIKKLEINVLNIVNTGTYELSGTTKGTMLAINTNNLKGNININLNNASIDTDSKKAPAIYVYNKETTYTDCKVTINPLANTKNYIDGGKLKKVSLLDKDNLNNYSNNYSNTNLDNYNKYTSYYGIYNSNEINNILFATVKADSEDLNDGDPLYFYKASGAISSDIDLYFKGKGYLNVSSKNKEGIETKGNLEFQGGIGDYEVFAYDDCLNTTTAKSQGTNVRNTLTIDVNSLTAIVNDDGDEGDAIDSNGDLIINGGTIKAFAHSKTGDSGLDSENGTVINKGTIISTGNMQDSISNNSKQKYIYVSFNNTINKDSKIEIKDQNDNLIYSFTTTKDIKTLLYSNNKLNYKSLKIYVNNNEVEFNEIKHNINKNNISNTLLISLLIEISLLVIVLIINKIINK